MDPNSCPLCHVQVRPTDYFCYNCGKNLHPAPPSLSFETQAGLYLKSIILPPFGVIWAYPYLRAPDLRTRIAGWVAIILTLASLVWAIQTTVALVNDFNLQLNQQLQTLGGF